MDDHIRRLLAQQEAFERAADPVAQFRKLLGPASATSFAQLALETELETRAKLLRDASGSLNSLASAHAGYDESAGIRASLGLGSLRDSIPESVRASMLGELNAARRFRDDWAALASPSAGLLAIAAETAAMERLQASTASAAAYRNAVGLVGASGPAFRLAAFDEIASLAKQATELDRLTGYAFSGDEGLASLTARMTGMSLPWLKAAHEIESVSAFAHLQAIGNLVHEVPPYADGMAAWLRVDLGDWRDTVTLPDWTQMDASARTDIYVTRGFNPELTAFTPPAFFRSAAIARLPAVEDEEFDEWCDEDADELARNQAAFNRLQRFERMLRKNIANAMFAAFGELWMERQLPQTMLDKWKEKRETAIKGGAQERPLIEYADFTDYLLIIEKKDNWRQVYHAIFGRPEDVRESLQRMYPVRIATMHARPITLDDALLIMVETKRVMRALAKRNDNRH